MTTDTTTERGASLEALKPGKVYRIGDGKDWGSFWWTFVGVASPCYGSDFDNLAVFASDEWENGFLLVHADQVAYGVTDDEPEVSGYPFFVWPNPDEVEFTDGGEPTDRADADLGGGLRGEVVRECGPFGRRTDAVEEAARMLAVGEAVAVESPCFLRGTVQWRPDGPAFEDEEYWAFAYVPSPAVLYDEEVTR